MQFDRKCVSSWEALHLKLIADNIPIEEMDVDAYCRHVGGDFAIARDKVFGPEPNETYTCVDLITTIWQGIRNSCVKTCPDCHDLLRAELNNTPVVQLAEVLGWINIQQIMTEFIRFVATDMLFSFMTKRLGISFMEVGDGTIVCGYNGDRLDCGSGWAVIPMFCRITNSSYLSNDIVHTMCFLRLLYQVKPFVTIGLTYELAFANIVNELIVEYTIQTFAVIELQRAWRKRKERQHLFTVGLVLYRKTGIIQGNLKLCYEHLVSPISSDISMVHSIMF